VLHLKPRVLLCNSKQFCGTCSQDSGTCDHQQLAAKGEQYELITGTMA